MGKTLTPILVAAIIAVSVIVVAGMATETAWDIKTRGSVTVKGFAKHEKETLQAVVEARAQATQTKLDPAALSNPQAFQKFQQAQGNLSQALGRLLLVVERYPELKSNANFRDLQAQLEGTENRIAVARKRYIEAVAQYNKGIRYFPTNLTAKYLLHLETRETYKVEEKEKELQSNRHRVAPLTTTARAMPSASWVGVCS